MRCEWYSPIRAKAQQPLVPPWYVYPSSEGIQHDKKQQGGTIHVGGRSYIYIFHKECSLLACQIGSVALCVRRPSLWWCVQWNRVFQPEALRSEKKQPCCYNWGQWQKARDSVMLINPNRHYVLSSVCDRERKGFIIKGFYIVAERLVQTLLRGKSFEWNRACEFCCMENHNLYYSWGLKRKQEILYIGGCGWLLHCCNAL